MSTSLNNNLLNARRELWIPGEGPAWYEFGGRLNKLSISATAGAAELDLLETAAGATQLISQTVNFGAWELTQAANDNDVISIRWNAPIRFDGLLPGAFFETWFKFKVTDGDDCDVSIGFAPDDDSIEASEPTDLWLPFRSRDASGAAECRYGKDSSYTTKGIGFTLGDDTFVRGYSRWKPTSGNMDSGEMYYKVHYNGSVYEATFNVANQFPDDLVLFPVIQFQNGAAAADVMTASWFYGHGLVADYVDGT